MWINLYNLANFRDKLKDLAFNRIFLLQFLGHEIIFRQNYVWNSGAISFATIDTSVLLKNYFGLLYLIEYWLRLLLCLVISFLLVLSYIFRNFVQFQCKSFLLFEKKCHLSLRTFSSDFYKLFKYEKILAVDSKFWKLPFNKYCWSSNKKLTKYI